MSFFVISNFLLRKIFFVISDVDSEGEFKIVTESIDSKASSETE